MNIFDINVRGQSDKACQEIVFVINTRDMRRRRNVPKRFSETCQKLRVLLFEDNAGDATNTVGSPSYRTQYRAEVANERWTSGNVTTSETKVQACNCVVANHCAVKQNRQVLVHRPPEPSAELREI
jgi:hypothetical protein